MASWRSWTAKLRFYQVVAAADARSRRYRNAW